MKRVTETAGGLGFWVAVAYFGLALVVVWLYVVNSRTLRDQAIRIAEAKAARVASVQRCLESRGPLTRVSYHVRGVNDLAAVLVKNSARILEETPRTDPQYEVVRANLLRLIRARAQIGAVKSFPVPTVGQCRSRDNNN